jgi:hypothetical protein
MHGAPLTTMRMLSIMYADVRSDGLLKRLLPAVMLCSRRNGCGVFVRALWNTAFRWSC